MKVREGLLGMVGIALVMAGCGTTGQNMNGASPLSGAYYTRQDAEHDREVAQARREAELERQKRQEAEWRAQEAEYKAQKAQKEAEKAKKDAQRELAVEKQRAEEIRELGPEDFNSYAEYREYIDNRNGSVVRISKNGKNSYAVDEDRYDAGRRGTPTYSERYSDAQGATTVNNYYMDNPAQRYDIISWNYWYDRPSYSYIVTFDPWFNIRYRIYRDWYSPFYWGYVYDPFAYYYPTRWAYDYYGYYYNYYGYWGYPYNRHSAWHNGYYWGYNDGYRDGYYYGGGYAPQASIAVAPRQADGVRAPRAASMSGYGRAQRSTTYTGASRTRAQSVTPSYTGSGEYGSTSRQHGANASRTRTRVGDAAPTYQSNNAGDLGSAPTYSGSYGTRTRTRAESTVPSAQQPTYSSPAEAPSYPTPAQPFPSRGTRTRTRTEPPSSTPVVQPTPSYSAPAPSAPAPKSSPAPAPRTRTRTSYSQPTPSYSAPSSSPSSSPSTRGSGTPSRTRTR